MNLAAVLSLAFAIAIAGLCWLRRAALPGGLAEGVVLGALGCAGPLIAVAGGTSAETGLLVVGLLAVLVGCFKGSAAPQSQAKSDVWRFGGLVLVFTALMLDRLAPQPVGTPVPIGSLVRPVAALIAFALLALLTRRWPEMYAVLIAIPFVAAPYGTARSHSPSLPDWAVLIVVVAVLALVVGSEMLDWHRRRQAWNADMTLLERGTTRIDFGFMVAALATTLLVALPTQYLPLAPIAFALGALAVAGWAHMRETGWAADLLLPVGMALGVMAAGLVVPGWMDDSLAGWRLGLVVAGGWAAWLARVWEQQLLDGRPWTSAGRLIPTARRLALAGSLGVAALSVASAIAASPVPQAPWLNAITVLGLVYLMLTQLAESGGKGGSVALIGALFAALGLSAAAGDLLANFGIVVDSLLLTAIVGLGVALLLGVPRYGAARKNPGLLVAALCGILPLVVLFCVASEMPSIPRLIALAIAVGGAWLVARRCAWFAGRSAVEGDQDDQV